MTDRATDAEAQLRAAEERIFAAIGQKDAVRLELELTDDFVHAPLGGAEQNRAAFLQAIRDMPYAILEIGAEDLRVRALGDVAIVSGIQCARVSLSDGQLVSGRTAFVDTFTRLRDGWRLRHAVSIELPTAENSK